MISETKNMKVSKKHKEDHSLSISESPRFSHKAARVKYHCMESDPPACCS